MPEKKPGMLDILKGVFKSKKGCYEDIVYQAEKIISDYVARRRNEIINKYASKKSKFLKALAFIISGMSLYLVYKLII